MALSRLIVWGLFCSDEKGIYFFPYLLLFSVLLYHNLLYHMVLYSIKWKPESFG